MTKVNIFYYIVLILVVPFNVHFHYLAVIELAMWPSVRLSVSPCVRQSTPRTADVTVTKIGGYVRVHILMNR